MTKHKCTICNYTYDTEEVGAFRHMNYAYRIVKINVCIQIILK